MKVDKVIHPRLGSFLGWLGGKTLLRPTIINCMPDHFCYVEVFCGSATVFFGKPGRLSRVEIVNDIHSDLVNLMKVISGTYFDESIRQEFIGYVRTMPASREAFQEWQKWDEEKVGKLNPAQRAFWFYYCTKKGFSSVLKGGYEASPFAKSRLNMSTDFDQFAARFRERDAQIEHLDFLELIEKYNKDKSKTFFFADPPYWVANDTNYYEHTFSEEQHMQLYHACQKINECKNTFMLTYDDVPEICEIYRNYYIYRTEPIQYYAAIESGQRDMTKTELVITNYDIAEMLLKRSGELFPDVKMLDRKIEIPGHIGLELL